MRVKGGKRGKLSSGDHTISYRDGNELGGKKKIVSLSYDSLRLYIYQLCTT